MQTLIQSPSTGISSANRFPFQHLRTASPRPAGHKAINCSAQASSGDQARADAKPLPRTDVSHRFGIRLRELRRERSLTQVRMATEFGIDRSFISDVERGKKSLSLPMLEVIALGMEISLSELLRDI